MSIPKLNPMNANLHNENKKRKPIKDTEDEFDFLLSSTDQKQTIKGQTTLNVFKKKEINYDEGVNHFKF